MCFKSGLFILQQAYISNFGYTMDYVLKSDKNTFFNTMKSMAYKRKNIKMVVGYLIYIFCDDKMRFILQNLIKIKGLLDVHSIFRRL